MAPTQVCIRDVDDTIFRRFKAASHQRGLNIGEALNIAISHWMEDHKPRKRFLEFEPSDWGAGTESVSMEIDKVLYGKK